MKLFCTVFVIVILGLVGLINCDLPEECKQPVVVGDCRARASRYHYKQDAGKCELFYYGGCHGNANNFKTQEECEEKCKSA